MQNFLFANLPFERGKILFSKGFFVYTDGEVYEPNSTVSKAYKPRTWYTFCQMGTMTQGICKLKNNEKKNKKIQHERMRQGNARIIVIHPFVFGLSIFLSLLVKSNGWNV